MFAFIKFIFYRNKEFYKSLKKLLGFYPNKIWYYEKAFIHRSASSVMSNGMVINNERLEFLGDAVLDAIISEFLFTKFPNENEGFLTQMRSKIVNGAKLSEIAKKMDLNSLIISNINTSNNKKHIYEDAFEALIGAIFIDKGYRVTYNFVEKKVLWKFFDLHKLENTDTNYKSQLIEWGQKYRKEVEFYTDLESINSKYFISYVRIDNQTFGSGIGISKKEAEQKAAKATLENVER